MSKNFSVIVKFLLFFIFIGILGGMFNVFANSTENNKIILSEKYNTKKVDRIKSSINQKNNYRFLINTTDSLEAVSNYFSSIDKKIKIKEYSDSNFMIRLSKNTSLINKQDIENGILPVTIGKYNVVQPEIVEGLTSPHPSPSGEGVEQFLLGEENDKVWGNNLIGADLFQEELSIKDKIKVGVLDTGIDYSHTDLDNNYNSILSYDFVNEDNDAMDDNGHGTHVAGIIGAEVNGIGRYGVNSNSDLVSLKVLDSNGIGTTYDILDAIEYAKLNDIKVLNLSFGGIGNPESSVICSAISDAKVKGIFTIVSAGNNNTGISNIIPAGCSDSIVVGSINQTNVKTDFSNFGSGVIYAPGVDIYTTDLNNNYKIVEGTSFSAGFISGLVSKELAFDSSLSYDEVINSIKNNYNLLNDNYFIDLNEINIEANTGSGIIIDNNDIGYLPVENSNIFNINSLQSIAINNLVGHWDFNQCSAKDNTNNSRNGLYYGTPACVDGKDGKALKFGGMYDRDYVVVNNNPNISLYNDFSYNIWFKVDGNTSMDGYGRITNYGTQTILAKAGDRSGLDIRIGRSGIDGLWYPYIYNGRCCSTSGKSLGTKNGKGLNLGEWHMITFTNGNGYSRYYLDGELQSEELSSVFNLNTSMIYQNLQFGISEGRSWYPFNGTIDDIQLYNKGLILSEIEQLYGKITIPTPTNLQQYIKSPLLEQEVLDVGKSVGKFQSGSGIILEAEIQNETTNSYNLVFDVYKQGGDFPFYSKGINIISGTGQVIIPYLGEGNYTWKARVIDNSGNESEIVDYNTNQTWERDFSLFEGFEPYPYGFSFINASPDYNLLTGKITGYNILNTRKKEYGTKWEIMDMIFPLETFNGDERKYFAAFETLGLNNKYPGIFNGNCFGLSLSSLTQYNKPEILKNNFLSFSNNIGTGFIFDKINIENDKNNGYKWIGLDDNIKSILSLQLYQKEESFDNKMNFSYKNDTTIDILNKIKNKPGKYILTIKGKVGCKLFGKLCTDIAHAVIPYKVEGNRIYIRDNNTPYPLFKIGNEVKKAYEVYIEIDTINNKYTVSGYNRDKFEKLGVVSIDEAFTDNTSIIGFNDTDILYTLNGNSDLLITDSNGNKTGYKNGEIYEEIPGTRIITSLNGTLDNTIKQIYLPQKLENITIEVNSKTEENYDLMIAGGDYYTKLEGIFTNSGHIDIFNISRENIKIDFDDNKTGTGAYNLLIDDFQNNGTGSIYVHQLETIKEKQNFDISWNKVVNKENSSIFYSIDTNNDGIFDLESYFNSISKSENEAGSISGYVKSSPSNAGYKVCIDKNNNGKCEENIEQFMVTDNIGNYRFDNLSKGNYNVLQVSRNNWEIIKPLDKKYSFKLNNGQNIVNLNFENSKINGNKNNNK